MGSGLNPPKPANPNEDIMRSSPTLSNLGSTFSGRCSPFDIPLTLLTLFAAGSVFTDAHYVDATSPSSTPPFTSWATAATNIQDALDAATAGDEVVVTNVAYATGGRAVSPCFLTNRVMVDRAPTVRSVNGPEVTIIEGYQVPDHLRHG